MRKFSPLILLLVLLLAIGACTPDSGDGVAPTPVPNIALGVTVSEFAPPLPTTEQALPEVVNPELGEAAAEAWAAAGHTAPDGYVPPVSQAGGGAPAETPANGGGGGCPAEGCLLIPVPIMPTPEHDCFTLERTDGVVETYCP